MTKSTSPGRGPKIVASYDYTDKAGKLLFQAVRYEPGIDGKKNTFRQRQPNGRGGWIDNIKGVRLVLYRLPELAKASAIRSVYIVEGEKDAETLRVQELLATTNAMGAGKWRDEYSEHLRGRHVLILPDDDQPGRDHADKVKKSLSGVAASVIIVELPGLPEKGDVTDWFALSGNDKRKLLEIVKAASDHAPPTGKGNAPAASEAKRPPKTKPAPKPYQPFPVHALPQPLASLVSEGAAAYGCDPAYFALHAMTAAAASIGNTRTIRLRRDWREPSVMWSAVVGDSGTLKSPAYKMIVSYFNRLEKARIEEYTAKRSEFEEAKAQYDRDRAKQAAGRPTPTRPVEPVCSRLLCSDITIERIAGLLADNPRGLFVARDELGGWFASFVGYRGGGGGSDLPQWLEMFRAETIIVDRKTGDRQTIFVPRAAVSITGTIQPGTLRRALTTEQLEAGLGSRILLAMPPKIPKEWTEVEIHPDTQQGYERLVDGLLSLQFAADSSGDAAPLALSLSLNAKTCWVQFYNEWAGLQAGAEGDLASCYSKLEAYAARFALIRSVVTQVANGGPAESPIEVESVKAAIELVRWFAAEARRIYSALTESDDERHVRRLIDFIRSHGGRVGARRLQRSNPGRYQTAADAEAALEPVRKGRGNPAPTAVFVGRGGVLPPFSHRHLEELAQMGFGEWVDQPSTAKGGHPTRLLSLNCNLTPDTWHNSRRRGRRGGARHDTTLRAYALNST
jgi:Protein of unknown function (DUF3987)